MIHVLSLGAGVQSTTMALMAAHGEIAPMPDCAIFADTQWEPKGIYDHLRWLTSANVLPFPVHIVTRGSLRHHLLERGAGGASVRSVPFFIKRPDGEQGIGMRQCTKNYKIEPIRRYIRQEINGGKTPKGSVQLWIGMSTDEAFRVKPSQVQYIVNRWPLIERNLSRNDCLQWLRRQGYPEPSKSSCLGCPYHSDAQWRAIRDGSPDEWQQTVADDKAIRVMPRMNGEQFMHRSLVPLDQVDLRTHDERGQPDLFLNECEGMCGV